MKTWRTRHTTLVCQRMAFRYSNINYLKYVSIAQPDGSASCAHSFHSCYSCRPLVDICSCRLFSGSLWRRSCCCWYVTRLGACCSKNVAKIEASICWKRLTKICLYIYPYSTIWAIIIYIRLPLIVSSLICVFSDSTAWRSIASCISIWDIRKITVSACCFSEVRLVT